MKQDHSGAEQRSKSDNSKADLGVTSKKELDAVNPSPHPHLLMAFYQSLMTVLLPIYLLVKLVRSALKDKHIKQLSLRDQYAQSLGYRLPKLSPQKKQLIWIHAVSLGELNTVKPLIDQLLALGYPLLITNTTATGFWRTEKLYAGQLLHCPMVIDQPAAVQRFLTHFSPAQLVLVETEIWPTLLDSAYRMGLPVTLINARMTQRSAGRLGRLPKLSRYLFSRFAQILCQDPLSVTRFVDLGASRDRVKSCTNLKYLSALQSAKLPHQELQLPAAKLQRNQGFQTNQQASSFDTPSTSEGLADPLLPFVLTAASTHDPEERMIIEVFKRLSTATACPLMLILVPRHPERFDEAARMLSQAGLTFCRRSEGQMPGSTPVFLGDSLGELELWYAMSDLAFVGGSIANVGGHTPMEAAKYALPVVMGPHTHKCQDMVDQLTQVEALSQAQSVDELYEICLAALNNPRLYADKGAKGQAVLNQLANKAQQQIDELIELIKRDD